MRYVPGVSDAHRACPPISKLLCFVGTTVAPQFVPGMDYRSFALYHHEIKVRDSPIFRMIYRSLPYE
jgi:hypothetical protein